MPKSVPIQLLDALGQPVKSTCFLVKIKSRNPFVNQVFGFTTLDARLRFNDGYDDLIYRPTNVLQPQNIQSGWNIKDVDNTELHGWFDDAVAQVVSAGLLGDAEITIYRVLYNRLSLGAEVVAFGSVGKAEFSASKQGSRKVEFRGLSDMLVKKRNPVFSLTCRNDFGDERCGKPFVWHVGNIIEVGDPLTTFKVDLVRPVDYFNFGVVVFKDGNNQNFQMEVEQWYADGTARLSFVTPYPIQLGEVWIRQDCDKLDSTCINVYNNIPNFNGEHLTPVQDQSLMVPGAYIKTNTTV
jgi:uncharacterized phage protein (TIGR02218 family)